MLDTSARLLRLLATLQSRRHWTGGDLAEHLEITPRTLRRDVDKLRSLGYAVEATAGHGGGYALGKGSALPPLLLDDDEAVAVAVSLRSASDTFAGLGDTTLRVLAKLEQLLPSRLRNRLGAVHAMTVSVHAMQQTLPPDRLTEIAAACRDRVVLSFGYRDRDGKATRRTVEPLRLGHAAGRRWYLLAWDRAREDWRTFRVDRFDGALETGARFLPRDPPGDVATFLSDAISHVRYKARVKLQGSLDELSARVPCWCGRLEPLDDASCVLTTGADSVEGLVSQLLLCRMPFELLEPLELAPQIRELAALLERCVATPRPSASCR